MRHLVIGNSHVAALKLGWDKIKKSHRSHELTFAGARGEQFRKVHLNGTILTSSSGQGRQMIEKLAGTSDPIDVSTFDQCWIVGAQLHAIEYVHLVARYRSETDVHLGHDRVQILSEQAFDLAASTLLANASALPLATEIAATGMPVGLIPQPMLSHGVLETRRQWKTLDPASDFDKIAGLFAAGLAEVAQTTGATIYAQPESTLATPITTKDEFARGSSGLADNKHKETDDVHMNRDYGRIVLETHLLG